MMKKHETMWPYK